MRGNSGHGTYIVKKDFVLLTGAVVVCFSMEIDDSALFAGIH